MKTFVRLIRRYVLAAVGIVLLLLFSGVAVLGWLGWQEGCRLPQREYSSSEIADSMVETAEGLAFGAERTPQEWMNGYEWAMVLDDVGNIRWSYGLPQELNHAYTPGDIAKFSRWYLADYPVFCWTEPRICASGCAITAESRYIPSSDTASFALSIAASTAATSPVSIR